MTGEHAGEHEAAAGQSEKHTYWSAASSILRSCCIRPIFYPIRNVSSSVCRLVGAAGQLLLHQNAGRICTCSAFFRVLGSVGIRLIHFLQCFLCGYIGFRQFLSSMTISSRSWHSSLHWTISISLVMSGSWDANKEQNNEPRIRFLGHLDSGDVTPSSDFLWYRYYLIRWSSVRVSELSSWIETVSVKRTSGHSLVLPLNTCCNIDSMIFAVILLLRVLCDDSVLKYTFYLIYTRLTIYSTIA